MSYKTAFYVAAACLTLAILGNQLNYLNSLKQRELGRAEQKKADEALGVTLEHHFYVTPVTVCEDGQGGQKPPSKMYWDGERQFHVACEAPAPKPATRKDDCPYSDGCVTISSHTYWSVIARLKSDTRAMDRAKEELKRLTKACSGGANPPATRKAKKSPCATWGDDCAFVDDLRQKPQP